MKRAVDIVDSFSHENLILLFFAAVQFWIQTLLLCPYSKLFNNKMSVKVIEQVLQL